MSFWDVVWFIVIAYAFVAYLMLLFSIIGDLLRDRDVSGVAKAAWFLALVVFPFFTALVYVIVRGRGMAGRALERAALERQRQDDYIRQVAGGSTPIGQIAQAQALLEAGAISRPEYEALKTKALV